MDNEEEVVEETLETPEETVPEENDEEEEDTVETLKARLAKAEEIAENQKKRAEKAEKAAKDVPQGNLSTADILALSKANVEQEDLDDVLEYAAFKKTSIAEALASPILKATLAEKAEHRKSAAAVNTGTGRRASTNVSDDRLMADAQKGIMPESEADIARLATLRLKQRK